MSTMLSGASDSAPMLGSLFGYFFYVITVLTAAVVLFTGVSSVSTLGSGRHYPRSAIARTITVETQRHSPAAKEASPAKDASPVVATAQADTKKIKHHQRKVVARYAEESRYGPSGPFFR